MGGGWKDGKKRGGKGGGGGWEEKDRGEEESKKMRRRMNETVRGGEGKDSIKHRIEHRIHFLNFKTIALLLFKHVFLDKHGLHRSLVFKNKRRTRLSLQPNSWQINFRGRQLGLLYSYYGNVRIRWKCNQPCISRLYSKANGNADESRTVARRSITKHK